jgi:hypothetical protein
MSLDVVVYNRTNASTVTNGDLVLTTGGRDWSVTGARAQRQLNRPGTGSVSIPTDHPNAAALTYRNVVRMIQDGEVVKSFVVQNLDNVAAADDDAKLLRTASGEGLLTRLKEMVRLTPNPIDELPLAYTRRHDWAAPETSAAGWTDTVYEMDRNAHVLFGIYRPVGWPTPIAPDEALGISWIHTVPSGDSHPAGTQYYHRSFTLASETEVALFVSAADQFEAAIDGVVVLDARLTSPNSVWWWTWKAGVTLAAGTHTIRIKVDVINATGQGGMICALFDSSGDGIDDLLVFTGDDNWSALDNPADPPGQTPGQIIRLGLAEASARGCQTPTLGFSDTVDSNGDAWTETVPLVYRVPTTEWDVLNLLTPWVEFEIPDSGYELDVYNLSTGVGDSASTVELDGVRRTTLAGTA